MAQFVHAAATPRMSWALPWYLTTALILVVVASFFPAAIWAGALAPTPSVRNTTQWIAIPTFNVTNTSTLWGMSKTKSVPGSNQNQWLTPQGLFSIDVADVKGALLSSASDASVLSDGVHLHPKLDKTGFSWVNRSYGVGSTAGFTSFHQIVNPSWFTFTEIGFSTSISCHYNKSVDFKFYQVSEGGPANMYQPYGTLANGSASPFLTYVSLVDWDTFAWSASYSPKTRTLGVQHTTLATTTYDPWGFSQLNNVQCDITFQPQLFNVMVNTTGKLITSTLLNKTTWPNYGDQVIDMITDGFFTHLSYLDGCLGGSGNGRALRLNINQLQNITGDYSNSTVLQGTEDFWASLVDNVISLLLLTRMVGNAPQPTQKVLATIGVPALIFGDFKFIIIITVINMLVVGVYVIELLRTKAWAGIPDFDLMQISDIIVGSYRGGVVYGGSGLSIHPSSVQYGDRMKMRLQHDLTGSEQPILMPVLDESYELKKQKKVLEEGIEEDLEENTDEDTDEQTAHIAQQEPLVTSQVSRIQ